MGKKKKKKNEYFNNILQRIRTTYK